MTPSADEPGLRRFAVRTVRGQGYRFTGDGL